MAEVGVPGHQGHLVVEAGLGNQGVRQFRLVAAADGLRSQATCPFPVARLQGKHGDLKQCFLKPLRELGVAQNLTEDDGRKAGLALGECDIHRIDILARGTR
jgi:hypothetical protein